MKEWATFGEFREWCETHVGQEVSVLEETFVVRRGENGLLYLDPV